MHLLDTDHLSVLDRGGSGAQPLLQRLANLNPGEVVASIISYEEQLRGWFSYLARAQNLAQQVEIYRLLKRQLTNYCAIPLLEFDGQAAQVFQQLRKNYPRVGTMDLKIAAIAVTNGAILLTRNTRDFAPITNLRIEDWT